MRRSVLHGACDVSSGGIHSSNHERTVATESLGMMAEGVIQGAPQLSRYEHRADAHGRSHGLGAKRRRWAAAALPGLHLSAIKLIFNH